MSLPPPPPSKAPPPPLKNKGPAPAPSQSDAAPSGLPAPPPAKAPPPPLNKSTPQAAASQPPSGLPAPPPAKAPPPPLNKSAAAAPQAAAPPSGLPVPPPAKAPPPPLNKSAPAPAAASSAASGLPAPPPAKAPPPPPNKSAAAAPQTSAPPPGAPPPPPSKAPPPPLNNTAAPAPQSNTSNSGVPAPPPAKAPPPPPSKNTSSPETATSPAGTPPPPPKKAPPPPPGNKSTAAATSQPSPPPKKAPPPPPEPKPKKAPPPAPVKEPPPGVFEKPVLRSVKKPVEPASPPTAETPKKVQPPPPPAPAANGSKPKESSPTAPPPTPAKPALVATPASPSQPAATSDQSSSSVSNDTLCFIGDTLKAIQRQGMEQEATSGRQRIQAACSEELMSLQHSFLVGLQCIQRGELKQVETQLKEDAFMLQEQQSQLESAVADQQATSAKREASNNGSSPSSETLLLLQLEEMSARAAMKEAFTNMWLAGLGSTMQKGQRAQRKQVAVLAARVQQDENARDSDFQRVEENADDILKLRQKVEALEFASTPSATSHFAASGGSGRRETVADVIRQLERSERHGRHFVEDTEIEYRRQLASMCSSVFMRPFVEPERALARQQTVDLVAAEVDSNTLSSPPGGFSSIDEQLKAREKALHEATWLNWHFKRIGMDRQQAAHNASLFAKHGFGPSAAGLHHTPAELSSLEDEQTASIALHRVLKGVTGDELYAMGIVSVGERRTLLELLQHNPADNHGHSPLAAASPPSPTVGSSQRITPDRRSSLETGSVASSSNAPVPSVRQLDQLESPKLHQDPHNTNKVSQHGLSFEQLEDLVLEQRAAVQQEEKRLQNAWTSLSITAKSKSYGLHDPDGALWESQWRRATIEDLRAEKDWERAIAMIAERVSAMGPSGAVPVDDLPEAPQVGGMRGQLVKMRSAGQPCPRTMGGSSLFSGAPAVTSPLGGRQLSGYGASSVASPTVLRQSSSTTFASPITRTQQPPMNPGGGGTGSSSSPLAAAGRSGSDRSSWW